MERDESDHRSRKRIERGLLVGEEQLREGTNRPQVGRRIRENFRPGRSTGTGQWRRWSKGKVDLGTIVGDIGLILRADAGGTTAKGAAGGRPLEARPTGWHRGRNRHGRRQRNNRRRRQRWRSVPPRQEVGCRHREGTVVDRRTVGNDSRSGAIHVVAELPEEGEERDVVELGGLGRRERARVTQRRSVANLGAVLEEEGAAIGERRAADEEEDREVPNLAAG